MHTNYVSQLLRIPRGTLKEMLVDIGPAPDRPTGMFLTGYENDTWMFTVFGMVGHQPPRDLAGMLSFAQEYCPAHLIAAMRAAEPIGEVAHHHMPSSQWRRYDKMPQLPDGLLVCGDAICSVNPIYGQGMTVAALEAAALRECLRGGGSDLPRRYFRASAKPIGVAWQMVAAPTWPSRRWQGDGRDGCALPPGWWTGRWPPVSPISLSPCASSRSTASSTPRFACSTPRLFTGWRSSTSPPES